MVLHDPSREKSHYISSWHMFLPSDVTHGFNKKYMPWMVGDGVLVVVHLEGLGICVVCT